MSGLSFLRSCMNVARNGLRRAKFLAGLLCPIAAIWAAVYMSSVAGAETSERRHLVQDWSARHVVFTGLTAESAAARAEIDPRAWHSWMGHGGRRFNPPESEPRAWRFRRVDRRHRGLERDWQMTIGAPALDPRVYPAKFSFDVNAAPDCTRDYVVFPTTNSAIPGASGAGVAASLVAFNNLYTGPGPTGICPTPLLPATQPSVLFAYNTTTVSSVQGFASLSPALSLDGKKIVFVETNTGSGNNYTAFHVLTWKSGEGAAWDSAAAPGDCSAGNSCLTTLVLSSRRSDSESNVFVDYAHDTAYVGDDGGLLHKITSVFGGTPAEVTGGGWPVQLASAPDIVLSPVYDSESGRVFVTDAGGSLYVVDAGTGAIIRAVTLLAGSTPSDVTVDSTDQTVFVFYSDSSLNLTVSQFDTAGTLLRKITAGVLGNQNVYSGTFDNNYYNSPSSGSLYFAGSVNFVASVYSVGFTGTTMNATVAGPLLLSTSSTTSTPTPLTEIFNPTFSTAQDRLFLGIDANCANGNPNGCIESVDISNGLPSAVLNSYELGTGGGEFTVSALIIDNVSSLAQASSIYFESLPLGGGGQTAIKLTQLALQ